MVVSTSDGYGNAKLAQPGKREWATYTVAYELFLIGDLGDLGDPSSASPPRLPNPDWGKSGIWNTACYHITAIHPRRHHDTPPTSICLRAIHPRSVPDSTSTPRQQQQQQRTTPYNHDKNATHTTPLLLPPINRQLHHHDQTFEAREDVEARTAGTEEGRYAAGGEESRTGRWEA
ncbi:hypothetical protein V490_00353 [Pseudogymnoascus sp. VKM F-3557]|nr:hypothetical protein V490_00353 [Pseudogymnoascus sp. VKM F-3557]